MKLEKVNDPGVWIESMMNRNPDLVLWNPNKPISEQILKLKGKTLLIIKHHGQTCFYELMEELEPLTNNFKIYQIEFGEFWVAEVKEDGRDKRKTK